MRQQRWATFKYQYAGAGPSVGPLRRWSGSALLLGAGLLFTQVDQWAGAVLVALLLVAVGLGLLFLRPSKQIQLGQRFLVCGQALIYYANITRLVLSEGQGRLTLQSVNGQTLVIERTHFPTNARKSEKIRINQTAKFNRIAGKIIERVRRASPSAELVGVTSSGAA